MDDFIDVHDKISLLANDCFLALGYNLLTHLKHAKSLKMVLIIKLAEMQNNKCPTNLAN